MTPNKNWKLKQGDFVKVETDDGTHLGEYQGRDKHLVCLKGDAEFIYLPAIEVAVIRKPFVTVEESAP